MSLSKLQELLSLTSLMHEEHSTKKKLEKRSTDSTDQNWRVNSEFHHTKLKKY